MLQYGSCPKGCGASVAYASDHPDVALDGVVPFTSDGKPCAHECATVVVKQRLADAMIADIGKRRNDVRVVDGACVVGDIAPPRVIGQFVPVPVPRPVPNAQLSHDARMHLLEDACLMILRAIGDDVQRPGLVDTPERFARMMLEFFDGSDGDNDALDEPRMFEHDTVDQLVIVDRLDVWSMCEHHLLPFSMSVDIGYIARGRVLGLSKFGRIARRLAARLTMQERYVETLADAIAKATGSPDVIVVARGEHLCMLMRGARMGHRASSAALRGAFRTDAPARAEFYSLVTRR